MREESLWEGEAVGTDAGARCSGFCLGKHVGMRHAAVGSTCQAGSVGATGYEPSRSRQTDYLRQMICVFPQKGLYKRKCFSTFAHRIRIPLTSYKQR